MHILRLVGKLLDIKAQKGYSGKYHTLFIDFRSAFDKVDHNILLSKLSEAGISVNTVSMIKLLYNSYQFSVLESKPMRIKAGVAQGSLISPLLFDWYVDSLVRELAMKFGTDRTFAYADDIAILCYSWASVREAIDCVETWAKEHGAELNKSKCGILTLKGREKKDSLKVVRGIPTV